jgi:hypothetical protein
MAFDFLTQGKAKKQFLGLFRPEENESQDNVNKPSASGTTPIEYETPMMNLYKESLESMPDESNYHNGILRKILAGAAAVGSDNGAEAYKTTKGILDEPYESDLNRWKQKTGTTGELASLEERINATKAKSYFDFADLNRKNKDSDVLDNYRQVQTDNLRHKDKLEGRTKIHSDILGQDTMLDEYGKPIWSVATDETPDQKDTRHLGLYGKEKGIDFRNETSLIGARAAADRKTHEANTVFDINNKLPAEQNNAMDMEEFKHELQQDNIQLQHDLAKTSPEQQNSALAGAMVKVKIANPEFGKFYNPDGSLNTDEAIKDPDNYQLFKGSIANELNNSIGTGDVRLPPVGKPKVSRPKSSNPLSPVGSAIKTRKPEEVSDDEAKQALISKQKAITPESIAMAKQLLAAGSK